MTLYPGGTAVIILGAVFIPLDIIAVGLRLWARHLKKTSLKLTDYLIILALILNFVNLATGIEFALNGLGAPIEDLSLDEIVTTLKLFVAAPIVWGVTTCVIKLSVLTFYCDIFTTRAFQRACYVLMVVVGLLLIGLVLSTLLLCHPFAYAWDKTIPGGTCTNSTPSLLAIGAINMVIDFTIVLLPMPLLWNLQMPVSKKFAISFILMLGLLVSVFSALRLPAILAVSLTDFTQTAVLDITWGALEILIGVITACLPMMQPPLAHAVREDSAIRSLLRSAGKLSVGSSGARSMGRSMGDKSRTTDTMASQDPLAEYRAKDFHRLDDSSVELTHVQGEV